MKLRSNARAIVCNTKVDKLTLVLRRDANNAFWRVMMVFDGVIQQIAEYDFERHGLGDQHRHLAFEQNLESRRRRQQVANRRYERCRIDFFRHTLLAVGA